MPGLYEIPLSPAAQSFSVQMSGASYGMLLQWRTGTGWVLDIADANDASLVAGIPLVTGVNLLQQYQYLGFGVALLVATDGDLDAVPTYDNLGQQSHLYFYVP
jgi:hypothetical protein